MRTTIRLDDDLLRQAKRLALETGRTLTDIMDEALRQLIARRARRPGPTHAPLPTFGGGRMQPGVDLDNNASLRDLMDENGAQTDGGASANP